MIKVTRGALVPEKTFWYAIDFEWMNRELEYMPHDELNAILMMEDPIGNVHNVEHLAYDDAQ